MGMGVRAHAWECAQKLTGELQKSKKVSIMAKTMPPYTEETPSLNVAEMFSCGRYKFCMLSQLCT